MNNLKLNKIKSYLTIDTYLVECKCGFNEYISVSKGNIPICPNCNNKTIFDSWIVPKVEKDELDIILNVIQQNFQEVIFKNRDLAPLVEQLVSSRQLPSRLNALVLRGKLKVVDKQPKAYALTKTGSSGTHT